jgi:hypothetical protein
MGDGTAPVRTISQTTISASERATYGIRSAYAAQVTQSTAPTGGSYFSLYQFFPQDRIYELAGRDVMIQFKAKVAVSGSVASFGAGVQFNFGSGGSPAQLEASGVCAGTPGTSYSLFTVTIQVPSLSSVTFGTGASANIFIGFPLTGTYTVDIVDVSVTKGQEIVLFDLPTLAETQAEAFQYYEVVNAEGFNGTAWYGCSVPKRNSTSLSIAHSGSGSPTLVGTVQQNGALVSDTSTESLTLTFSCSEP